MLAALHLRRRSEFLRVQSGGKRFRGTCVFILVAPNGTTARRLGLTVSRKVGNAVIRNRVRRRLREIVRHDPNGVPAGYDLVIIALSDASTATFQTLAEELQWLIQRAHAWASSKPS